MHDRNVNRVALVAAVLILALFGIVYGQAYAAETEREGKRAACEQGNSMLEKAVVATAVPENHPGGEGHAGHGAEKQQQAAHEKALIDAVTKCTIAAVIPDEGRLVISFFLAGIGPTAALIALFLNGVRYEAGMRNAFAGSGFAMEMTSRRCGGGRAWNIRNVGLAPVTIIGVSMTTFPGHESVRFSRSSFERFVEKRRIDVGGTLSIDSTATGKDLLVAVLFEHDEGRHSASWARFHAIDAGDAYEKREEGRLLSI